MHRWPTATVAARMCIGWLTMRGSSPCVVAARILPAARFRALVPLLLSMMVPTRAHARVDTSLAAALQHASRIRVQLAGQRRFEGSFQELTPTHLRFRAIVRPTVQRAYFADLNVARESISRLWVRDGSHWRIGALVGGLALGLIGFGVAMAFVGDSDTPGCSGPACVVGATAVFGAAGAVGGELVGTLVIRWRPVWPP